SFNSRAGFKLLAISAVWARLAWRSTMFEGADIRESTYIDEPTTGVNGRATVLREQRLGVADFCPGAQFISHVRSVRPRSSGGIRVDLFFDPLGWFPISASREVASVPGLETRLVKPVEFQAGRS